MDSLPDRPLPARRRGEVVHAWLHWFGVVRLAVTAAAVLAVGAGGYWLLRAPPTAVESTLPYAKPTTSTAVASSRSTPGSATTVPSPPSPTAAPRAQVSTILVYVAGAVAAPGVYRFQPDARVQQAIAAAGGATAEADLETLNLAALMRDGDRVYVPRVGQPVPVAVGSAGSGTTSAGTPQPVGPVDLNRATVDELDALPGIGPATAAAIVAHREQKGPFSSVDGLLDVRGIGPSKLDAIRALVKV